MNKWIIKTTGYQPFMCCCLLVLLGLTGCQTTLTEPDLETVGIPESHQQVLLVLADSWGSPAGILNRFTYTDDQWVSEGDTFRVSLGKNGLGWGIGLHEKGSSGPVKQEGDGKAPAGIFELGTMFGYNDRPVANEVYPYKKATDRDYFIDDVTSDDYNQWVTIPEDLVNDPSGLWNSYERMRREDQLYECGIVVSHNMSPVEKGKGSAIFLHIWRGPESPTLGCTAMSKQALLEIMEWLDPEKKPILILVPVSEWYQLNYAGASSVN